MHNCDCCEGYDNRKMHSTDRKSPFFYKMDAKKPKSTSFSIDAILSKPGKRHDVDDLAKISRNSPVDNGLASKSCLFDSCRPRARQMHSCCSKSCCRPPSRHLDYLAFYRYSRFVDDDTNDAPRRCLDEPATMVQVSKHGFPVGCAGCPDCSLSIQRLNRDHRRLLYNEDDVMVQDENMEMRRNKRKRTIFTAEQLDRLEHEFQQQQYVVGQERKYLAVELGLNEIQVKVWFQNRRIKWRKQKNSRMPHVNMPLEDIEI